MNVVDRNTTSDVAIVKRDGNFHCLCCSLTGAESFVMATLPDLVEHLQNHADAGDLVPTETFAKLKGDMEKQITHFENRSRLILAISLVCGVFAIIHLILQPILTPVDVICSLVVLVGLLMVLFLT